MLKNLITFSFSTDGFRVSIFVSRNFCYFYTLLAAEGEWMRMNMGLFE